MANETVITLVGNLTGDPELKFLPSGAAVANFAVASTPRTYDKQTGQWKDGEALFLNCSVWRQAAENVAESLRKGMRVIVQGRLHQRSYENQAGERRTVFELEVDEIGPSLTFATAAVARTAKAGNGQQGGYQPQGQPAQTGYGQPARQGGYGQPAQPPAQYTSGQGPQAGNGWPQQPAQQTPQTAVAAAQQPLAGQQGGYQPQPQPQPVGAAAGAPAPNPWGATPSDDF